MKITEKDLMNRCNIEGYFILSSRRVTNKFYNICDLYCRDHNLIIDYFEERIIDKSFDTIVGIGIGGALIGSGLAERLNKSIAIFRVERSSLGQPYGKCLLIDDVSSTGQSLRILEKWVSDCGASISQTIVAIDRRKDVFQS